MFTTSVATRRLDYGKEEHQGAALFEKKLVKSWTLRKLAIQKSALRLDEGVIGTLTSCVRNPRVRSWVFLNGNGQITWMAG